MQVATLKVACSEPISERGSVFAHHFLNLTPMGVPDLGGKQFPVSFGDHFDDAIDHFKGGLIVDGVGGIR